MNTKRKAPTVRHAHTVESVIAALNALLADTSYSREQALENMEEIEEQARIAADMMREEIAAKGKA